MAKTTVWRIQAVETEHVVTYSLNKLTGRMTVSVDGDEFILSAGFLSCKAARREPFRLVGADGEAEQAILTVDKKGKPSLIFRAQIVPEDK